MHTLMNYKSNNICAQMVQIDIFHSFLSSNNTQKQFLIGINLSIAQFPTSSFNHTLKSTIQHRGIT